LIGGHPPVNVIPERDRLDPAIHVPLEKIAPISEDARRAAHVTGHDAERTAAALE
jgi:hypothetical protein